MQIKPFQEIPAQQFDDDQMKKVSMRIAVGAEHGAPNFVMRVFSVEPGGYTTHHSHEHEHEVFFHSGKGCVLYNGEKHEVEAGHVAFIEPHSEHQIQNTGDTALTFVCVVPLQKIRL